MEKILTTIKVQWSNKKSKSSAKLLNEDFWKKKHDLGTIFSINSTLYEIKLLE